MYRLRNLYPVLILAFAGYSPIYADVESIYGMIAFVSGEAWVVHPGSEPVAAKPGMTVKPNDTIKTGKGQIRVQIADIYICHIEKNTTVAFKEILNNTDSESMNIHMGKGQIFSRLIPGKTKKTRLLISTPTVTAGVRGTDFMVSEKSEEVAADEKPIPSGVYVSEGKVDVESTDGKFRVSVNGGEQAVATPGELRKAILEDFVSARMKILDELKIMKEYNCKLIDEQKEKNRKLLEELK